MLCFIFGLHWAVLRYHFRLCAQENTFSSGREHMGCWGIKYGSTICKANKHPTCCAIGLAPHKGIFSLVFFLDQSFLFIFKCPLDLVSPLWDNYKADFQGLSFHSDKQLPWKLPVWPITFPLLLFNVSCIMEDSVSAEAPWSQFCC